jgi:hypothetical protein
MKKIPTVFGALLLTTSFASGKELTCDTLGDFQASVMGEANVFCTEYEKACQMSYFIKQLGDRLKNNADGDKSVYSAAKKYNADDLEKTKILCLAAAYGSTDYLEVRKVKTKDDKAGTSKNSKKDEPIKTKKL